MGKTTNIEWSDATWNVAIGCTKVSDGCKFCYMMRDFEKRPRWQDVNGTVYRVSDDTFNAPLKWKEPMKVFTSSLTDFFHPAIDSFRHEAWDIIRACPHLTFQILTKRPERVLSCLPADWGNGYPNVWLGVTVENQQAANARIPIIADWLSGMDNTFFVSFEPLLGPIDLYQVPGLVQKYYSEWGKDIELELPFHWAILGGESGNDTGKYRYRPCEPEWITDLMEQLQWEDVAVFVKQLGTHLAKEMNLKHRHGADASQWPDEFCVQHFPKL